MSTTHSQQRNSFFGVLTGLAALAVAALIVTGIYLLASSSSAPEVSSEPAVSESAIVEEASSVSAETEAESAVAESVEPAAVTTNVDEAAVEAEPVAVVEEEPAAEVEPVAIADVAESADLHLAVADRALPCALISEAMATVMEENFDMSVSLVEYDSADSLFASLSDGDVDMTLCFVDPEDREQISGVNNDRIGYMRQLGSAFWDSGNGKLQIWAFGAAKSDLRADHPCAYELLESLTIADGDLNAASADEWLANNAANVDAWTACGS